MLASFMAHDTRNVQDAAAAAAGGGERAHELHACSENKEICRSFHTEKMMTSMILNVCGAMNAQEGFTRYQASFTPKIRMHTQAQKLEMNKFCLVIICNEYFGVEDKYLLLPIAENNAIDL